MADFCHLEFYRSNNDSLKSPCGTSYRSSIEIALNCLVIEKIVFLCTVVTDRQTETNKRKGSIDA